MQTFLPYSDFTKSAQVLDMRRLGKQRVEVLQILRVLYGESSGWQYHPAVLMWNGYSQALVYYGIAICNEWIERGYRDICQIRIAGYHNYRIVHKNPPWLGDEKFHSSHRAALLFKKPEYYSQFGWTEKPEINYYWPMF